MTDAFEAKAREIAHEAVVTRRAPHMERYTEILAYPTEENPNAHQLTLRIGVQSFLLSEGIDGTFEDLKTAEFYRDMLCIALDGLVNGEDAIASALREAKAEEREACAAFIFAEAHEFAKADPLSSDQNIACALSEVGVAIRARGPAQKEEAA